MKRAALVAVLALLACQEATGPEDTMRLMSANERRWQMAGVRDYDYQLGMIAMLSGPPVKVEVRSGSVIRVVDLNTGREVAGSKTCCTIDELFGRIRDAAKTGEQIRI